MSPKSASSSVDAPKRDAEKEDAACVRWKYKDEVVRSEWAALPTAHGTFRIMAYTHLTTGKEHLAIVNGNPEGARDLPVRIHSECLTGDVLGSLRCDCGEQLDEALSIIGRTGGVVVYLRQEGRGIGLTNKVRAYTLQDQGFDTVKANLELGFPADARRYDLAAYILQDLGVASVRLITNNPAKITALEDLGFEVAGRIPIVVEPNEHNRNYLKAKKERLHHLIDFPAEKEA